MASLHKFKLLATQCAVSGSPTQSPTTSPVFHLRRRRKTLRMLLSRTSTPPDRRGRIPRRDNDHPDVHEDLPEKRVRRKLKDLFVSSPPPFDDQEKRSCSNSEGRSNRDDGDVDEVGLIPVTGSVGGNSGSVGLAARRGALRPVASSFRYRLMRRAWRPVLLTIPETE